MAVALPSKIQSMRPASVVPARVRATRPLAACLLPKSSSSPLGFARTCVRPVLPNVVGTPSNLQQIAPQRLVAAKASSDGKAPDPFEAFAAKIVGKDLAPKAVTISFILFWYALNIAFNLQNKLLFKDFPFPWTVSTVHVVVGTVYCAVMYAIGQKKASFERPITQKEAKIIFWPALMHALGHIAANISFAAVAISLTHTVKTLEPAFNVAFKYLLLGQGTPFPVLLTLVPIMAGVALASAAELSFSWLGFSSAMLSNVTFGLRAVLGKGAMSFLGSTGVYAYTTLIAMLVCAPLALIVEGPQLQAGIDAAIAKMGLQQFITSLFSVGLLYHLYNQFAFNTLERVDPVAHGVCNVVKRVAIIGTSVLFFGNVLTTTTQVGTVVAILGTYLYTEVTEAQKKKKDGGEPKAA